MVVRGGDQENVAEAYSWVAIGVVLAQFVSGAAVYKDHPKLGITLSTVATIAALGYSDYIADNFETKDYDNSPTIYNHKYGAVGLGAVVLGALAVHVAALGKMQVKPSY